MYCSEVNIFSCSVYRVIIIEIKDDLPLKFLDLKTKTCNRMKPNNKTTPPKKYHSISMVRYGYRVKNFGYI